MKKLAVLFTFLSCLMIVFSGCSSDDEKELIVGDKIGNVIRNGKLYYFEKYNLWVIEDRDVSMDSNEFYLILNPDSYVRSDHSKNEKKEVEVAGTLYNSEIREGDFDNYYFIKIETLDYK